MNETKEKWIEEEVKHLKNSLEIQIKIHGQDKGISEFLKSFVIAHELDLETKYGTCPTCNNKGKHSLNCDKGCWQCKYCDNFEVSKFCNHEV